MASVKREILEPDTLARLGRAFDAAWAELSGTLALGDDETSEQARLRLAAIFMELVKAGQLSSEEMKSAAIRAYSEPAMALSPEQVGATTLASAQAAGEA
jgi:hypothetical protein